MNNCSNIKSFDLTVVCQVFYPDPQSTSQLLTDLLTKLVKHGLKINVICGFPADITIKNEIQQHSHYEEFNGIRIYRTGLRLNFKANLLYRAIHYIGYIIMSTFTLSKLSAKSNLIVGVTNPPFTPVWLYYVSKIFRFKYHLMIGDIYPDGLIALNKMKKFSFIKCVWIRANYLAFKKAERIQVLGRDMENYLVKRYMVSKNKICNIPNWSPCERMFIRNPEETNLWKELKLNDSFVVQYSGNMGLWHDIETLVRAAFRLQDEETKLRFLFIGGGSRAKKAKELAKNLKCINIIWLPFQNKESLSDSLACCHLSIISQRIGLEGIAVPCKLYGILASGRAILGMVPKNSETAFVIKEEKCGVVIDSNDDIKLTKQIIKLKKDKELFFKMGKNAYEAYRYKYNLNKAVKSYFNLWSPDARN